MTAGYRCEPVPRGVVMVNGRTEPAPEGVVFVRDDRSREQLIEEAQAAGLVPSIPTFLEFFEALRAARPLLAASAVELTEDRLHILCPASATFDTAEALRLELVAAAPAGVTVDVEIAAGLEGSVEDQAGRRLFGELRGERAASSGDV